MLGGLRQGACQGLGVKGALLHGKILLIAGGDFRLWFERMLEELRGNKGGSDMRRKGILLNAEECCLVVRSGCDVSYENLKLHK